MRFTENSENEEGRLGFAEWLWPVPNNIKALYFVLTSVSIIIVLSWRAWYEISVSSSWAGWGNVAIEVIGFSPAAGFISMFAMSVLVAGGMTVFGKGMYRQGVIVGEERGEARGREIGEAHGREFGKSQGLSEAASWYQRKLDAEAHGEPFDEPPPWERNGSKPSRYDDTANS